jgi:hypothetical protein
VTTVETVTVDHNSSSPWSSFRLPNFKKPIARKLPDLEAIKRDIPLIENLHPSFWRNPNFLNWQLLRLNEKYQKDVDALWYRVWTWFARKKTDKTTPINRELLYKRFPPVPPEAFEKWREDTLNMENYIILEKAFNAFTDFPPYPGETFQQWYDSQYYNRNHPATQWYRADNLLSLPERLDLAEPPPIPWVVRFPLPHFLENIPSRPPKRARPQEWALNLLVYELSQAGLKNAEITKLLRKSGKLLFGVVKSYKGTSDKDPLLVRIYDIKKKRIEKEVFEAYPLSKST